jgi:hypothetical protein
MSARLQINFPSEWQWQASPGSAWRPPGGVLGLKNVPCFHGRVIMGYGVQRTVISRWVLAPDSQRKPTGCPLFCV